jgi:hypothetical protein
VRLTVADPVEASSLLPRGAGVDPSVPPLEMAGHPLISDVTFTGRDRPTGGERPTHVTCGFA